MRLPSKCFAEKPAAASSPPYRRSGLPALVRARAAAGCPEFADAPGFQGGEHPPLMAHCPGAASPKALPGQPEPARFLHQVGHTAGRLRQRQDYICGSSPSPPAACQTLCPLRAAIRRTMLFSSYVTMRSPLTISHPAGCFDATCFCPSFCGGCPFVSEPAFSASWPSQ